MFLVVSDRNPIQISSAGKGNLLANIIEVSSAFSCGWIQGGAPAALLTSLFGAFFWLYSQAPGGDSNSSRLYYLYC